ncbi:MAG: hypothetical protein IT534_10785 [Bauldia sp.]|nr:hypothetical protein [Bauldia sp.]
MSKYEPLGDFLRSQYGDEVRVRFAEIERILGFPLPPSARAHRPWWSNNPDNSAITKVWLNAGFRTEQVDMAGETLVFVRAKKEEAMTVGFGEAGAAAPVASVKRLPPHPAIGAMKGMITIMPGVDLTEPTHPEWADMLDDPNWSVGGLDDPKPRDR